MGLRFGTNFYLYSKNVTRILKALRDIPFDTDDKIIVKTIINMAHSLGIKTIAEGVETQEQLEYLHENGCDEIQGYYYSKPLSSEDFETFVRGKYTAD